MTKTIAALAAFAAIGTSAHAVDLSNLSVTGTVGYESEYVFRGVQLDRDAIQASVELGIDGFYAGVWTSQGISNATGGSEVDLYAGYSFLVADNVILDFGATYYSYDDAAPNRSREVYVGLAFDYYLSPAVYFFYDFDFEQTVLEFSAGYSFDLSQYVANSSIDVNGYFGFVDADDTGAGQVPGGSNGYSYIGASVDYVYTFTESASASFGVRATGNNDGSSGAGNSVNGGRESNFWFGASFTAGF